MPNDVFVPKSESLKRVFGKRPKRSTIAHWYLWFSVGFHTIVLLRTSYMLWIWGFPFQEWDINQQIIVYASLMLLLITILTIRFFQTMTLYGWNFLYLGAFILDSVGWGFVGGATGNEDLIFLGQEDMFRLGGIFVLLHLVIIPIYVLLRRYRRSNPAL